MKKGVIGSGKVWGLLNRFWKEACHRVGEHVILGYVPLSASWVGSFLLAPSYPYLGMSLAVAATSVFWVVVYFYLQRKNALVAEASAVVATDAVPDRARIVHKKKFVTKRQEVRLRKKLAAWGKKVSIVTDAKYKDVRIEVAVRTLGGEICMCAALHHLGVHDRHMPLNSHLGNSMVKKCTILTPHARGNPDLFVFNDKADKVQGYRGSIVSTSTELDLGVQVGVSISTSEDGRMNEVAKVMAEQLRDEVVIMLRGNQAA